MSLPVLPVYSTTSYINKSKFDIDFSDDRMDNYFYKITDKFIHYNVDINLLLIRDIEDIIKKKSKIDIKISILDNYGEIKKFIYLFGVRLIKIKNLINFDYSDNNDIAKIKVKYKYKEYNVFNNENEISTYKRKLKLEKINDSV